MSSSFYDLIQSCRHKDYVTIENHCHLDLFNVIIDYQLNELNGRFSEQATQLFILSATLNPNDSFKTCNFDDICNLVEKFYRLDFSIYEKTQLQYELKHYEFEVLKDVDFQMLSTIGELCQKLVKIGTTCVDYSGFKSNHKPCTFSHENYKNKANEQDGR